MASPPQHKYDALAANLFLLSALLSFLTSLLKRVRIAHGFRREHLSQPDYLFPIAIAFLFVLAFYYCLGRGYHWAKIFFFIVFIVGVLALPFQLKQVLANRFVSPIQSVCYLLRWVLQSVAFVLLLISFRDARKNRQSLAITA
jgi:hypothetical protein